MISSSVSAVSNHAGPNRLNSIFFQTRGVAVESKTMRWTFGVDIQQFNKFI